MIRSHIFWPEFTTCGIGERFVQASRRVFRLQFAIWMKNAGSLSIGYKPQTSLIS
jgi:hypothetical protein